MDIDKILKDSVQNDIEVPNKIHARVKYSLRNKKSKRKTNLFRKILTAMASLLTFLLGSISVYAVFGGTIAGKPVADFFGIKFSEKYDEYVVPIENQQIAYDETKIDLVSSMCDKGFTVLKFKVYLSEKDREYLRLDENVFTEDELQKKLESNNKSIEESKNNWARMRKYNSKYTDEYVNQKIERFANILNHDYENEKASVNTVFLALNIKNYDYTNRLVIIDDKEIYVSFSTQTVKKISDYEYDISQIYFLTDKELGDKVEFKMDFKDMALTNQTDMSKIPYLDNEMGVASTTPNNSRKIELDGTFSAILSKEKALEDSREIKVDDKTINYERLSAKINQVTVTPMQVIIELDVNLNNISMQTLSGYGRMSENSVEYRGMNIYDKDGKKIDCGGREIKRVIQYSDGTIEEWAPGDIGTYKDFKNAKLQLTEYVYFPTNDNLDNLKLVPKVMQPKYDEIEESWDYDNVIEIDNYFEIDLRQEKEK